MFGSLYVAIMSREKKTFENVPFFRLTITRRIDDIAENLKLQLHKQIEKFGFFSVTLNESCDVSDTARLLVFLQGITRDFLITKSLVATQSKKGTTASSGLFIKVDKCFARSD